MNTPIELAERRTQPPDFLLEGMLKRCEEWQEALSPNLKQLTIYDRDNLESLDPAQWEFARQIRAKIELVLAAKNPKAIVALQDEQGLSARAWHRVKGEGNLAFKVKQKGSSHSRLAPTVLPHGQAPLAEWIMRDESYTVTVARTWEPGTQTLETWLKRNTGQEKAALRYFAGALRDAETLHQKKLVYVDWNLRNIAVRGNAGHLFDYEATVACGSAPYLVSKAASAILKENPRRYANGMIVEDDMEIAAVCLGELLNTAQVNNQATQSILHGMSAGRVTAVQAADLLDDLSV